MRNKISVLLAIFIFSFFSWFVLEPEKARAVIVCDNITIDSPNGGENWIAGSTQNITWSILDQGNHFTGMDIYYSTDSGTTFPNLIVGNTANDLQYEWLVPAIESSNVRIRLVGRQDPDFGCDDVHWLVGDDSDADFTISSPYSNIKDTLTDSTINSDSKHTIEYGIISGSIITDGSIKVDFADDFDLAGVTAADVTVSGGNVAWGAETINVGADTIVVPFTGDLDNSDGKITMVVGSVNFPSNPAVIGEYLFEFNTYTSADGMGIPIESRTFSVAITNPVVVSATVPSTLTFVVSAVASGQLVNGETTTVDSLPANINFGIFYGAGNAVAAHDLSVSTNATNGFTVTMNRNDQFDSLGGDLINDFTGTNASPLSWVSPPGSGTEGYFGYTTSDDDLGTGVTNRFISDKWSGSNLVPEEVMYFNNPTDGTGEGLVRVGYQLEVTDLQASGVYSTEIVYVCTAVF